MSTNFPTSLDTVELPDNAGGAVTQATSLVHSARHNNLADAVVALEEAVGVTGSAVATSHDYLIKSAANPGHTHGDVATHVAAGDPHTGYRLESADHTHASTGAQGGTLAQSVLASGVPSICQGRLALTGATGPTLYFVPYKGNRVIWGGGTYQLTLSGYSCSITNAALAANTLYYVYVYSNSGSPALEFQAATIPYVAETDHKMQSNGDETKTGDTSRLLVGMVKTAPTEATTGTLGAAITTTDETSVTMTGGHSVVTGDTIHVDSEKMTVTNVATNTLTVTRGAQGTTAATHSNGATVTEPALFRTGARYANVISFHNRMPIFLAGVGTTATTASATYEDMATESDNLCEFLTWGSQLAVTDAVTIGISGSASSDGAGGRGDILFGTTGLGSAAPVSSVITFTSGIANELQNVSGSSTMGLVEGHHEVNFWGQAYGGATISVFVNTFASTNG